MREASDGRTVTDTDSYAFLYINQSRQREDDRGRFRFMARRSFDFALAEALKDVLPVSIPQECQNLAVSKNVAEVFYLKKIDELKELGVIADIIVRFADNTFLPLQGPQNITSILKLI